MRRRLGADARDGCFDATRVVTNSDGTSLIDHLETHLDRFARSAAGLDIPFDGEAWRSLVADAAAAWTQPGEAVLRVMLTRGREVAPGDPVTGLLTIAPIHESALAGRAGISVATLERGHAADMFTEVSWLLGGIKTLSYAINVAAVREAKRRGVDDALFISSDGFAHHRLNDRPTRRTRGHTWHGRSPNRPLTARPSDQTHLRTRSGPARCFVNR